MASTVLKGDELLCFNSNKTASLNDFQGDRNVIIIHGFTSSAEYMWELSSNLSNNNFNVFQFNYNSYRGIEKAASSLLEILNELNSLSDGVIEEKGIALVCHSMGGLVGRAFVQLCNGGNYVKAIVTLGSPHDGTLQSSELVDALIKWGEFISTAMPYFTPECNSAMELTGGDKRKIIQKMNEEISELEKVRVLSISGGKPYLTFNNRIAQYLINKKIQEVFDGSKNDGLVCESSSDFTLNGKGLNSHTEHFNSYTDYDNLNHSFITKNHIVSLKICSWLKEAIE